MPRILADVFRDFTQPVRRIMIGVGALVDVVCKLFQFGDDAIIEVGRQRRAPARHQVSTNHEDTLPD
jgi:hypothetical protein